MKLRLTLQATGGTTTGFEFPGAALEQLDGGKRPKVAVTLGGFTWRSSIAPMGGSSWLGVSAAVRKETDAVAGQEYELDVVLDDAPREVVVPSELADALAQNPTAKAAFEKLSYSQQRQHVEPIAGAKAAETKARRVAKTIETLTANL